MRLGELLKKIFRKRISDKLVERNKMPAEDIYKSIEHQVEDDSRFKKISDHINAEQGINSMVGKRINSKKNIFRLIGVSGVILAMVVSLLGVIYMRISNSSFKEDKVHISITGPEIVSIGEEVEYTVFVENKNRVKLSNVIIGLNFPSNFEFKNNFFLVNENLSGARIEVGEILSGAKKEYKVKVLVNYTKNNNFFLKAFIKYKPDNVSSFFQSNTVENVKVIKSDIDIAFLSAQNVSSGELTELTFVVKNNGQKKYKQLILKVEYPEGFNFVDSTESHISQNNGVWILKNVESNTQREIKISGRLMGRIDSIKKFKVSIFKDADEKIVMAHSEKNINIIPSRIILKQGSNAKSVNPGAFVNYTIYFKNNSTTVLRNLILQVHLPSQYINKSEVKHEQGYYDDKKNIIRWMASDVDKLANLQPGEEGEVSFSVQVQNNISPKENKNVYIGVYSEIESLDVDSPIFENKKIVSQKTKTLINSIMKVTGMVEWLPGDNNGENVKSLQVNKKIFLRFKLDVKNTTNDLKDVKLRANFPSGVLWEKQIYPEGDNLEFHSRSNQIEWKIGAVSAGTGFITPSEKAEFVISVIPSINQSGQVIELINNMQIQAKDIFTGKNLEYDFGSIKSNMIKDIQNEGAVL